MNKQSKKPRLEVIAPTHIRASAVVPMNGQTADEPRRRSGIGFDHTDAVEEDYPPLTEDQMRAVRAAAPNPKPGSKVIRKNSLFR